jgi:DNA polymerase III delta prime subunit
LDLLEEVDPNNRRRKRQKSTALDGETSTKTEDVPLRSPVLGSAQRRQEPPVASQVEDLAKDTTAYLPDTETEKGSHTHIQTQQSTIESPLAFGSSQRSNISNLQNPDNTALTTGVQKGSETISVPVNQPMDGKPTKILHFNPKTGTIGSPPARKPAASIEAAIKPRSNSRAKQPKSKLVTICYSQGKASPSAIGLQIEQILNGTKRIGPLSKKKRPSPGKKVLLASKAEEVSKIAAPEIKTTKAATIAPKKPPPLLHPFFSGKPMVNSSNAKETTDASVSVVPPEPQTPMSLRPARPIARVKPPNSPKPRSSSFGGFTGFGASGKITKFPGAIEPAWPWKGVVHIRGNDTVQEGEHKIIKAALDIQSKSKKSKYQAIEILAEEDVIVTITADLGIDQVLKSIQDLNLDEYPHLPRCLRAPNKHFESGYELQKRIRKELDVRLPQPTSSNDEGTSEDEIQGSCSNRASVHPALYKAYASISNSLTAFDQFRYETQSWTHKHSPTCAAEVLQTGREAMILKEWLQNLTVMSVETGASDRPNSRASSVSKRSASSKSDPSGKRKRKSKRLDGFIISSDEEDNDMDEISEPEDDTSARGRQGLWRKTVIRQGDTAAKGSKDAPRLTNAIVVSGPHGCGKTAAVYAIAKELGFEVFEINSSSRRSGKDILEKVGDMTRNHLVQRSRDQAPLEPPDEDARRISDALAEDIKSGRQGTMNSFFKTKDATNPKTKPKKSQPAAKTSKSVQSSLLPKAPPKQQKQSLILFEEVDILYEEDKQFWSTVITLITQSKRPIIMTCQDESLVPLQALSLHAILRFSPPPVELAADYMLLVAANEGHGLQRDAVKALYQSRHLDLRASLTELNFWCQFAVGDLKGGLDWLCPRWPLGCDVDKHGNKVRVVSENTYEVGMGWLSQDFLESHMHYLSIEEETLHEARDGWNLDLGHWQKSIDMPGWADSIQALSGGKADDRARLSMYDEFADAMSLADLFSGSAFAAENQVRYYASSAPTCANLTRSSSTSLLLNCQTKSEKTIFLTVPFLKQPHS